jgi:hypothetical protein
MKKLLLFFLFGLQLSLQAQETFTYPHLQPMYDSMLIFRKLKVIPIVRKEENEANYDDSIRNRINLKWGMKKGLVTLSERGEYLVYNINVIMVENNSGKPLHIKSGEIIVGGRQDRVFAKDTIIPSTKGPHTIPVYCIEENRWSHYEKRFSYGGNTSSGLQRLLDSSSSQTIIWNEIRNWLKDGNQKSSSFAAFLHQKKTVDTTKAYIRHFLQQLPLIDSNTVGIIASTGHKILGADIFISPSFFYQTLPYLLEKYSLEAILSGTEVNNEFIKEQQYADTILSPAEQADYIHKKGKKIFYKGVLLQMTTY